MDNFLIVGTTEHLEAFTKSYLETANFADGPESGGSRGFTKAAYKKAEQTCKNFIQLVQQTFPDHAEAILTKRGKELTFIAPHDLWLTQRGHGAGFWDNDKGWDEIVDDGASTLTRITATLTELNVVRLQGGYLTLV